MNDFSKDQAALKRRQEFVQQARLIAATAPVHALEFVEDLERLVDKEQDPWTAVAAGEVLGMILGKEAGREARRRLLQRAEPAIAAHAALDMMDAHWADELIRRLATAEHHLLVRCILRALGRIRAIDAFDLLISYLSQPEFREDAVLALELLGDPRAIPLLEPYQSDATPSLQTDDRGCLMTVGGRVTDAISSLQRRRPTR